MDIKNKLKLSDASMTQVQWFREGKYMRLYQGGLYWAQQHGLPAQLECRALKSLPGGRLVFGEFNEGLLLRWLHECQLTPIPMTWGWCVNLPQPRCLVSEQAWLDEQLQQLPARRWRPSSTESLGATAQVSELLEEVRNWPATELSPMHAMKAIRRWQMRLQQLQSDPNTTIDAG